MAANGRMVDDRPAAGDPVSADYMCAMTLAFGVSAALYRRQQTGRGGIVDTSLMQAAMTLENNQLIRSEKQDAERDRLVLERLAAQREAGASFSEQLEGMPSNRALPMLKVYFRTYETADAVIAIACGSHSLRLKFIRVLGLDDPGLVAMDDANLAQHYDELMVQTEAVLRSKSSAHWIEALQKAGVPVSAVKFPVELFDDPQAQANGMFHTLEHPSAGAALPSPPEPRARPPRPPLAPCSPPRPVRERGSSRARAARPGPRK